MINICYIAKNEPYQTSRPGSLCTVHLPNPVLLWKAGLGDLVQHLYVIHGRKPLGASSSMASLLQLCMYILNIYKNDK